MMDRRTYEYEIPERLMLTKAYAPLNRLIDKMTKVANRYTMTNGEESGVYIRVKFFIEDEANIDKAIKIDGKIRALLATGGE